MVTAMPQRPGVIVEMPHVPSEQVRILLADDFEPWRKQVRSFLRSSGFRHIFEACDGLEAVQRVLELNPDIAILDIGMPGIDGIEVAKRLRQRSPSCKVIMLTQNSDEDLGRAASDAGAVAVVLKSQMTTDLIPAVHAALQTRR